MPNNRRGAVAVVVRQQRLLVIRRSRHVVAPRAFGFPGGGVEEGESDEQALVREMQEELGAAITPVRFLWRGQTRSGGELVFWLAALADEAVLIPNPAEVEAIHWMTLDEMQAREELLESNRHFLAALGQGEFRLD